MLRITELELFIAETDMPTENIKDVPLTELPCRNGKIISVDSSYEDKQKPSSFFN